MIDVLLLAPMPDEQQALLDVLPATRRLDPTEEDNLVYYETDVLAVAARRRYRVVVCQCDVGRPQATGNATRAIERWKPRFVILVGIAGGMRGEVALGDVLVADQLVDYEQQKIVPEQPQPRDRVYPASVRLMNVVRNLSDHDWLALLKQPRPSEGVSAVRVGPVATGDKVVGSAGFLATIQSRWPKLVGVEMEGASVALAVLQSPRRPEFLMVRGVSDLADEQKNVDQEAGWRPYAKHVAATYAIALLRSGLIPPSRKPFVVGGIGVALAVTIAAGIAGYVRHERQIQDAQRVRRRVIAPEARAEIVRRLRSVPSAAAFASTAGDVEADEFKRDLMNMFREGGWKVVDSQTFMFFEERRGIVVTAPRAAEPSQAALTALVALQLTGEVVAGNHGDMANEVGLYVQVWHMSEPGEGIAFVASELQGAQDTLRRAVGEVDRRATETDQELEESRGRAVEVARLARDLAAAGGAYIYLNVEQGNPEAQQLAADIRQAAVLARWNASGVGVSMSAGDPVFGIHVFCGGRVGEVAPPEVQVFVHALQAQGLSGIEVLAGRPRGLQESEIVERRVDVVVGAKPRPNLGRRP